ncbi:hypothetical protein BGZ73_007865 [Actinomortierella ambigua]|nr:hypothetical protein BGZ73_007865 [Actinomortierella ambigua]
MSDSPIPPPKDDVYTSEQLSQYNGQDESKPIFVAIKGTIFDVSGKRQMYGPGAGYNVFAGKDASKMETLDNWFTFFEKRYAIVGKVRD